MEKKASIKHFKAVTKQAILEQKHDAPTKEMFFFALTS